MAQPWNEFRDPSIARSLREEIRSIELDRPATLMEVCGGQTHTIYKYRLREMLPPSVRLVSGPGCPVCVTPISYIDQAVHLAGIPDVDLFTFGDLLRVPGTHLNLEQARARGGKVHVVYSPRTALEYARSHPKSQVVFLGIGFETTIPSFALALREAIDHQVGNFSVLLSAKRVPPVLEALLAGDAPLDGFITPGHVTSILGSEVYSRLTLRYRVPMVVGGFEPVDLLVAIRDLLLLLARGESVSGNAYPRAVKPEGNPKARRLIEDIFVPRHEELRGLGTIPDAGYGLREEFTGYDAARRFPFDGLESREPRGCRCGQVLTGSIEPSGCPLFGKACTPDHPIGACMVSSEGTCNAAFLHGESP
ncbi:MAG: hydrogenase formation protein HypD [Fibrobacteria bacterium]|nr:hydrogenase formation protein HypD [Fibrobacteria bacterium]